MDHDYNDVAAFLGIEDTEPQTPSLVEAAETRDPLNIHARLESVVPFQFQEQAPPPPQQSSSSFKVGVLQDIDNLEQILESGNTVFTPFQSSSQFRSNEHFIASSYGTRNMNAQRQHGYSQSQELQISSVEEANVHSLMAQWPCRPNQQQFSSDHQPSFHQNQLNMGSFHPGASYSTQVLVLPSSLSAVANQHASSSYHHELATSHVSPFEQHPSIMKTVANQEKANEYRKEATRKYLLKKSQRKFTKPPKYQSRVDAAAKRKRKSGRFVKEDEKDDHDPSQPGL